MKNMNHLFENEYMKIGTDKSLEFISIKSKKMCDRIFELDKNIALINHFVRDTKIEKIIFNLKNLNQISKESLLNEKLIPNLGKMGVTDIAIVTGTNKKVQSLLSEIGSYIKPVKRAYHIHSETFSDYHKAVDWISKK